MPEDPTGLSLTETLTAHVPGHLRRVRLWWVYVAGALLTLWLTGNGLYVLATSSRAVWPGFGINRRLVTGVAVSPEARAAGVRMGDRIVTVGGERVTDARAVLATLAALGPDQTVTMDLDRPGGGRYRAALVTHWKTIRLANITSKVKGMMFLLVGMLLFWFHPGRRESWAFLIACAAVGVQSVAPVNVVGAAQGPTVMWMLAWVAGALVGPGWLFFFLEFPYPLAVTLRYRRGYWIGFGAPLVFLVALLPWYPWYPEHSWMEAYGVNLLRAYHALLPVCVVAGVAALLWRYRRVHAAKQRAQLRALVVVSVTTLVLPVSAWTASYLGLVVIGNLWPWVVDLPFILFTAAVAYVIVRHDPLDIDRAVARSAATTGALLILGALYLAVLVLLPALVEPFAALRSPVAIVVLTLVAAAALRPLKRTIGARLEQRLGRDVDADSRIDAVRAGLRGLAGAVGRSAKQVERLVRESLGVDRVQLLLPADGGGWRVPTSTGEVLDDPSSMGLTRVVPMHVGGELVGGLGLGRWKGDAAEELVELVAREAARALRRTEAGERIGPYRVERFLAAGGMGGVYLGVREGAGGFRKEVAVKLLLPHRANSAEVVRRFLDEARVVASLSHQHIAQVFDLGETEDGYYIAMEYVRGVDARALVKWEEGDELPIEIGAHIVACVCDALDFAHEAVDAGGEPLELVHRDVTPHNVLLSQTGEVKLTDFGVARLRDEETGDRIIGKIAYLAPEQLGRGEVDRRADVFAAGVLLYQLVTGAHPFAQATQEGTMLAIYGGKYVPPASLRPDCGDGLAAAIERALARLPEDRFQTAAEMADAVGAFVREPRRAERGLAARVRRRSVRTPAPEFEGGTNAVTEGTTDG